MKRITLENYPLTLIGENLEEADAALAEVLLDVAVEQGTPSPNISFEEIERRLIAKGWWHNGEMLVRTES